jgi:hypothetical protein
MILKDDISKDATLSVIINVVETPIQLNWCLTSLRLVYRHIPVIVISDGVFYSKYAPICRTHSARYIKGERLKQAKSGGRWWLRTLTYAASTGADFVLKIDPDTKFQRVIRSFPIFEISGTLVCQGTPKEHIQGGIQAFSKSAINKLLNSKFFDNPLLTNPRHYAWDDNLLRLAIENEYMCSDAMLRKAKMELGLSWGNWSEVNSQWKRLDKNYPRFAISHPHKPSGPFGG